MRFGRRGATRLQGDEGFDSVSFDFTDGAIVGTLTGATDTIEVGLKAMMSITGGLEDGAYTIGALGKFNLTSSKTKVFFETSVSVNTVFVEVFPSAGVALGVKQGLTQGSNNTGAVDADNGNHVPL